MQLACCSVRQFSWFMAVSRPVKDSCSVSPAGALLVSSSDPGVKLTFPPDCTVETRSVTLQVGTTSGTVLHHRVHSFSWIKRCCVVSVSAGAGGVYVRGADIMWRSSDRGQSSHLPLSDPQHAFLTICQGPDPSAPWGHRYAMCTY